jgi:hypothetical protein
MRIGRINGAAFTNGDSERCSRSGHRVSRRGKGLPPCPGPHPRVHPSTSASLRMVCLDEVEQFAQNQKAGVASLRWCSPSARKVCSASLRNAVQNGDTGSWPEQSKLEDNERSAGRTLCTFLISVATLCGIGPFSESRVIRAEERRGGEVLMRGLASIHGIRNTPKPEFKK